MNQNVKEFIEQNIDLIEEHNWNALFDKWYTTYSMFDRVADHAQLQELFGILDDIGIPMYEHRAAREDLLIKYFLEFIEDSIDENEETITSIAAINSLRSYLGAGLIGLGATFVDICKQRGFRQVPDNKGGKFILP